MSSTHTCAQNAQKPQTFYKPGSWALEGGSRLPWISKFLAKKVFFLSFELAKTNFTTFGPPLEKSPCGSPPWKKSFRRLLAGYKDKTTLI